MKCTKTTCVCKQSHHVTPWQWGQATGGEALETRCERCQRTFWRVYQDTWCPECLRSLYPASEKKAES